MFGHPPTGLRGRSKRRVGEIHTPPAQCNPRRKRQRTAKGAGAGAGAGAKDDDKAPCVICLEPLPVRMTRAAAKSIEDMPVHIRSLRISQPRS